MADKEYLTVNGVPIVREWSTGRDLAVDRPDDREPKPVETQPEADEGTGVQGNHEHKPHDPPHRKGRK